MASSGSNTNSLKFSNLLKAHVVHAERQAKKAKTKTLEHVLQ